MKKIFKRSMILAAICTLPMVASAKGHLTPEMSVKIEVKDVCSVEKHGIKKVLAKAKEFNKSAIKEGVEFRRLNVNNTDLIKSIDEALKKNAKQVNPMHFKGKKRSKTKLEVGYATWRACTFGLRALQQKEEAKTSWRLSVPGDKFQY